MKFNTTFGTYQCRVGITQDLDKEMRLEKTKENSFVQVNGFNTRITWTLHAAIDMHIKREIHMETRLKFHKVTSIPRSNLWV